MRTPTAFRCRPICIERHWFPLLLGSSGSGGFQWGSLGVHVEFKEGSCGPPLLSGAGPYV